jgi:hypothetical protein
VSAVFGYAAEKYARSLADFGPPWQLSKSGGWLLPRALPTGNGYDAAGCYPLFCCDNWRGLSADLQRLPSEIIAVSLVADPSAEVTELELKQCFPDLCRHYKDHYFVNLKRSWESLVASHHQRNARQAAKNVRVVRLDNPLEFLPNWILLYRQLVERHHIAGQANFSEAAFQQQFQVPGLRAYAAFHEKQIIGMVLWMVSEMTAYYHLAAYSDAGYDLKASFAIFWHCLLGFAEEGIATAALGGGAGTFAASQGLSRFKQGWANEIRPAYLCGRILDRARYAELTAQVGQQASVFFPAYRTPALQSAA